MSLMKFHAKPFSLAWSQPLIEALAPAYYNLGMLNRAISDLNTPFVRLLLLRQGVHALEALGSKLTIEDILTEQADLKARRIVSDANILDDYIKTMDDALFHMQHHGKIKNILHQLDEVYNTGIPLGSSIALSTLKTNCPSGDQLKKYSFPELVQIAIAAYQAEFLFVKTTQPWASSALESLLFTEYDLLSVPLLSLFRPATLKKFTEEKMLLSEHRDWDRWILFILQAISEESLDLLSRIEKMKTLSEEWLVMTCSQQGNVAKEMLTYLPLMPFFTTKKIAHHFDIAFTTAQRGIEKLCQLNIIKLLPNEKPYRIYAATELVEILTRP